MDGGTRGVHVRCTRFIEGTVAALPPANPGEIVGCPYCRGKHILQSFTEPGSGDNGILVYWCGSNLHIGGLARRLVVDRSPRTRAIL